MTHLVIKRKPIWKMLNLSRDAVIHGNQDASSRILELENEQVNPLCAILEGFPSELMSEDLSQPQLVRCRHLIETTTDIERVSDFTEDLGLLRADDHNPLDLLSEKEIGDLDRFFKDSHQSFTTALVAQRDHSRESALVVSQMEKRWIDATPKPERNT